MDYLVPFIDYSCSLYIYMYRKINLLEELCGYKCSKYTYNVQMDDLAINSCSEYSYPNFSRPFFLYNDSHLRGVWLSVTD